MKVKEVIIRAAVYAGRSDVAELAANDETEIAEADEAVKTLLYCLNAVEDELARHYFSLVATEVMSSTSGYYYFEDFKRRPVKILSVNSGGAEVPYTLNPLSIKCSAKIIEVKYEYVPERHGLDGEVGFTDERATIKLLAAGTASEYCLINGETSLAQTWEEVYRQEIDEIRRKSLAAVKFPPRRWV